MPDPAPTPRPRARPAYIVGTAGGVVLGAVLVTAAWTKAIDPVSFRELIALEGLDGLLPASLVAMIGLVLETGLGALLLLGVRRRFNLLPTGALVLFFLFLTGRSYYEYVQGGVTTGSCGCFGTLFDRTPAEAFWQDALLLVPTYLVATFVGRPRDRAFPTRRVAGAGALTAAMLALGIFSPDLPLDDIATRLRPGREVEEICAGREEQRMCLTTLVPDLKEGEHLVVIADIESDVFVAAVERLNAHVLTGAEPPLLVLTTADEEARTRFFWAHAPSFEMHQAPEPLLRPLYRRLPRSFRVADGTVVETWAGLPPLPPADAGPEAGDR